MVRCASTPAHEWFTRSTSSGRAPRRRLAEQATRRWTMPTNPYLNSAAFLLTFPACALGFSCPTGEAGALASARPQVAEIAPNSGPHAPSAISSDPDRPPAPKRSRTEFRVRSGDSAMAARASLLRRGTELRARQQPHLLQTCRTTTIPSRTFRLSPGASSTSPGKTPCARCDRASNPFTACYEQVPWYTYEEKYDHVRTFCL